MGCIMTITITCTVYCAAASASGCIRQPWHAGCILAGPYTRYTPVGALSMKARWAILVSRPCAPTMWVCQASWPEVPATHSRATKACVWAAFCCCFLPIMMVMLSTLL